MKGHSINDLINVVNTCRCFCMIIDPESTRGIEVQYGFKNIFEKNYFFIFLKLNLF